MTTKTSIRVLGLAALAGIVAGLAVPTAFAYSDEAAISAPAITTNIFLCSPDDLDFFDTYPDWAGHAYEETHLTPHEEASLKAELAALDAAYESLFDRFYPEPILSEDEQAEFDAQLLVLDEEYDAVLANISAALIEGGDADAEPLFETLVTIDAKYEQLFDRFYPEPTLSEEEQAEFDVRLSALDWVYEGILERYGIESEHPLLGEDYEDWDGTPALDREWNDADANGHEEESAGR